MRRRIFVVEHAKERTALVVMGFRFGLKRRLSGVILSLCLTSCLNLISLRQVGFGLPSSRMDPLKSLVERFRGITGQRLPADKNMKSIGSANVPGCAREEPQHFEIFSRAVDPTEKLTICDHSCVQTLHNICVDDNGTVLSALNTEDQRAQARGRVAVVTNFNLGQSNRQHLLHEFLYPVMFYVANCWDQKHGQMYFSHRRYESEVQCGTFLNEGLKMIHWASAGKISIPPCSRQRRGLTDLPIQGGCYETVRYLLNPLRTACGRSREFRLGIDAVKDGKYSGNMGLGQSFRIEGDKGSADLVPINPKILMRGISVMKAYYRHQTTLSSWYKMGSVRRRPLSSLRISIVNRLDARFRRSTNAMSLMMAIRAKYPEIRHLAMYERMSWISHQQQVRIFGMSDIVIAIHGQCLANMVMMRPGSLVITQSPSMPGRTWDESLAEWGGVIYENVGCGAGCEGSWNSRNITDFNIEGIMHALSKYVNHHNGTLST